MFKKRRSIVQTLFFYFTASIAILFGLFAFYLIISVLNRAEKNIEQNKHLYIESKKELIKSQINLTINFINHKKNTLVNSDSISLKKLQKEILAEVAKIRFSDNGYIFVVNYNGVTLMNDVQQFTVGKNSWNIVDPNGVKIVQEERRAVEIPEGDYIYYSWYKQNADKPTPKISFVRGIPDWKWMVGTGIYLEDIDNIIKREQEASNALVNRVIIIIISIFSFLVLMFFLISRLVASKIEKSFNVFSNFFRDAVVKSTKIDTQKLHFTEFDIPAISANEMLEELVNARNELILFNKELEKRVEERTGEIIQQKEEIMAQNEEIRAQNDELEIHRSQLEKLIDERTIDLRIAKERAEESDKLKSAFLANISHEIRTPMNAIQGLTNLLIHDDIEENTKKELIENIVQSSNTIIQIIENIIDISKIQTGQLEIIQKTCDINTIIQRLNEKFVLKKQELGKDNIQILTSIGLKEKGCIIITDPIRLEQIFSNLIDNALKFTEVGIISFGYEKFNSKLKFFVKDNGIGLTEKQKSSLFVEFSKAEASNEKFYQGVGLGLSITKNLVKMLGGEIWVESEVNKGSSFYFTIPFIVEGST